MSAFRVIGSNETRHDALIARLNELEEEIENIKQELAKEVWIPIQKCPNEVLLQIFCYYLENGHHGSGHPYIRRLLLICKEWNNLIMSTSSLWSRIEIKDSYSLFDYPNHRSLVPYIKACIEHSNGLPLDVELDLLVLPDINGYIAEVIYYCDKRILGGADWDAFATAIMDEEVDLENCGTNWHYSQLWDALNLLLGDESDGAILARFRTLKITLPPDIYDCHGILRRLRAPLPQLVSLNLMHVRDEKFLAFIDLPVAESLAFDKLSLSAFKVSPAHLKHLSMEMRHTFRIDDLLPLSLLQMLKLSFESLWDMGEQSPVPVHLPHLHTLSFIGKYNPLLGIDFDLPSLDLLTIHTENIQSRLPKLSPRHIMWYFDKTSYDTLSNGNIMSLVQDVVMLSSTIEHITVLSSVREEVMAVLADFGEARADSMPSHVVIDLKDGRLMTIDAMEKYELAEMMDIPLVW